MMELNWRLRKILDTLPLTLESEHFIIHYGLRNPIYGPGLGTGGVRDHGLVQIYADALERVFSAMTNPPFERRPPLVDETGKTLVIVCDVSRSPFTALDARGIPYIVLPSGSDEPTQLGELQRAATEAVHEATHAFNFREHRETDPPSLLDSTYTLWRWFDEGTAVFMETFVLGGNPDYLRFAANWVHRPDIPLDVRAAWYESFMFVRYLARTLGHQFVSSVWMDSKPKEGPIDTIVRILGQRLQGPPADNLSWDGIFSRGYAMDAYFSCDHESGCFAPEIYARFGARSVAASRVLSDDNPISLTAYIDHMACHYYRFYIPPNLSTVRFAVSPGVGEAGTHLRAGVATVTPQLRRGSVKALHPEPGMSIEPGQRLSAQFDHLDSTRLDHLVLVVSNCGLRGREESGRFGHDDGQPYTVEVITD